MKLYLLIACLLVILSGTAHADMNSTNCQGNNDLLNTLTNLPGCIVEGFFSYTISGLVSSSQGLVDSAFKFIFASPDPLWFCIQYNGLMAVLESLYSIVLMCLAMFFILRSNDAEGRAIAKKWLENMIAMIVLLSFSFQLFQMALDFNTYLATSFANESMKNLFGIQPDFTSAIFALVILIPAISMMSMTFLTLLVRYLLIPFLLFLFPIAIFLYFIPITQSWGRTFIKIIAAIVFMSAIDALVILGLSSLFTSTDPNLADSLVKAFAVVFGFGALGIINLALFAMSILSIITQSKPVMGAVGLTVAGRVLRR